MTAEPTAPVPWGPDPIRQRIGGYTIEDVLDLPDGAPRVELLDGVMNVVPSPSGAHQEIEGLLWLWLRQRVGDAYRALMAVGIAVDLQNSLEPDVVLLRQPVDVQRRLYLPDQVAIAVEVVSPSTKRRDRFVKPGAYAAAKVPHFWRIEQDPLRVFAYDLVDGAYQLAGEADIESELVLTKPFEIRLPIRDIAP
jgi:Uma2 family endonuclease